MNEDWERYAKKWQKLPPRKQTQHVLKAIRDPVYFCNCEYLLNVKLRPVQAKIIREFYTTVDNLPLYNEGICVAGMRGGKTYTAAAIELYEAFLLSVHHDPAAVWGLEKGSKIFLMNVAPQATQSKETIFDAVKTRIEYSPYFLNLINPEPKKDMFTDYVIIRKKNVMMRSLGSASTTGVGRTVKFAAFDELAKFERQEGKSDVDKIYSSLSSSTLTFGLYGKRFSIGSVWHAADKLCQLYDLSTAADSTGKKLHSRMIGWKYESIEMHPDLDMTEINERMKTDPSGILRDFFNIPGAAGGNYYVNTSILKVNDKIPNKIEVIISILSDYISKIELSDGGFRYEVDYNNMDVAMQEYVNDHKSEGWGDIYKGRVLGVDPSTRKDAFGLAVGYLINIPNVPRSSVTKARIKETLNDETQYKLISQHIVVDGMWKFIPTKEEGELNEQFITKVLITVARYLNVRMAVFDQWSHAHAQQALRSRGVFVIENRGKIEKDDRVKDRLTFNTLSFCNFPFIIEEMTKLIQKGNKVDHPKKGSKDVYDSMVQVVWGIDELLVKLLEQQSQAIVVETITRPPIVGI